jgi:DNA polymerase (family 10)
LIAAGVKTIDDLSNKKYKSLLSKETTAYLELQPVDKIPHEFIKKFELIIKKISSKSLKLTLVGSYRRKKPYSRDVDIMITSNKENAIEIFKNKIQTLFTTRVYAQGVNKLSMIIVSDIVFKIDVFKTTYEEEIPMLIYATGSKEFNIYMRSVAKKQGYLLNQKGLFLNGQLMPKLKKEEDYFDILNIKYVSPDKR